MNNSPLPQEEDDNVIIDRMIEEKLFDERYSLFANREPDYDQYNHEMRPSIYPDVE